MKHFILELYSEEIPAKMQKNAEYGFKSIFENFFEKSRIDFKNLVTFSSPTRIVISAEIKEEIPEITTEIKGPKVGAPDQAINGFCISNNVTKENLVEKEINGQKCYFAFAKSDKQFSKNVIATNISSLLLSYTWPKSMVWDDSGISWIRPLRNILCLLGDEVINFNFYSLLSNNKTFGHKFMSSAEIVVQNKFDYLDKIKANFVILDREERKNLIKEKLQEETNKLGYVLNFDEALLEEVTGLAEYPVILVGRIKEEFLALPSEVLITSMKTHQKYFTAYSKDGSFAPIFLFVTNLILQDYSEIINGNERVLSARLSDALFFYNADKEINLRSNIEKLSNVIYHTKLGSVKDKIERINKIAKFIENEASEAALICKSDLVSNMVGEFPELQGIMGGYYAKHQAYSDKISDAIKNHYKPLGADDSTPTGLAAIISIADKLDSLVSLYIAGERATGSKDPYGLRRYCLGIIRTILDNKLDLDIIELINLSSKNLPLQFEENSLDKLLEFFEERLKHYLKDSIDTSILNATISFKRGNNILSLAESAKSLNNILKTESGQILLSLYKRAKNISSDFLEKENIDFNLLESESEKILLKIIDETNILIEDELKQNSFDKAVLLLQKLQKPLDNFFEENLVNSDDIALTLARKKLLKNTSSIFEKIADFGAL